jgi:putative ABC transport system permease protein
MFRLHLGWLQLKSQKLRALVALAGVCFAVTLILTWLGFESALYDSSTRYHEELAYDVVLVNPEMSFIADPRSFSSRRLYQALALEQVASVSSVYLGLALWKNPDTHDTRPIFVVGFDPAEDVFQMAAVRERRDEIRLADHVLYDRASRPEFGNTAAVFESGERVRVEVNHREVQLAGLFDLGTSFGIDGSLITSDTNFLRLFPQRERGLIDLGLVRLAPGADPERVRDALRRELAGDVLVLTKRDFIRREHRHWASATPIGYVFGFGVIIGFVVGAIIVYQILFADVSDHLAEYATLKAMGYSNRAVSSVVIEQALLLAVLGFVPGVALSLLIYRSAAQATMLPLQATPERLLAVLGLTMLMCCISGLLALRKVRAADPAEVF